MSRTVLAAKANFLAAAQYEEDSAGDNTDWHRIVIHAAMRSAGLAHMIGRDGGGITFHSLRHTFGTQMASAGVPLVAIKQWLGHADITTTMIYAKWGKDRAADRALVDAAFATASPKVEALTPSIRR